MKVERTTIKTIALEAGVSVTTVSLLLNNKAVRVSKEKKAKILEIAQKYNYTPNSIAVSLVTKKTRTIGLLIPDISNIFFAEISRFIEDILGKHNYSVFLCNTSSNTSREEEYFKTLLSRGIDGLIFCSSLNQEQRIKYVNSFSEMGISCVALDRHFDGARCSAVMCDHQEGAYLAVKHLLECGHRKIGCISGPKDDYSTMKRLEGYKQALLEYQIDLDHAIIYEGDYLFESGCREAKKLLLHPGLSAIFACNDMMAYGVYKAARELGIKIPEDLSLVGFDDITFSSMIDIPLTTVKQPIELLARATCSLLLKLIESNECPHEVIRFSPELTIRNSVRKV